MRLHDRLGWDDCLKISPVTNQRKEDKEVWMSETKAAQKAGVYAPASNVLLVPLFGPLSVIPEHLPCFLPASLHVQNLAM